MGWRGDGRDVPGNEPGGAHGRYGRYGQQPEAPIPDHEAQGIEQMADHHQMGGQPDDQQNAQWAAQRQQDQGNPELQQGAADAQAWDAGQQHERGDPMADAGMQGDQVAALGQALGRYGAPGVDPAAALKTPGMMPNGQRTGSSISALPDSGGDQQNAAIASAQQSRYGAQQQAPAMSGFAAPQPMGQAGQSYGMSGQPPAAAPQTSITPLTGGSTIGNGQQNAQAAATAKPAAATTPTSPAPAPAAAPASPTQPAPQASPTAQPAAGANATGKTMTPFGLMAKGGIITHPTKAIIGENGPEAVIPLDNPEANITPGMFSPHRYRPMTGPAMTHHPIRPLAPASLDPQMKHPSGWKKWDAKHGQF